MVSEKMLDTVRRVVIVGGGSAGWLTAGILASHFLSKKQSPQNQAFKNESSLSQEPSGLDVVLVESPDVPTIGVGEGTWPSMRTTLQKMGISETQFMRECDVSLKQGSRFNGWAKGGNDYYYHPFSLPQGFSSLNLAKHWHISQTERNFADSVCSQAAICDQGLAPKQISTPEFAFNVNYGYHLDAGKFATFIRNHCVNKLGVKHIQDHVTEVKPAKNGDIASIVTRKTGEIEGDLFIDCTGFASILMGQHYGIESHDKRDVLFNDSAIAVQVPYADGNAPVLSYTLSTAQTAGWVWDIGLPTRRGVGYVYSSGHTSDATAHDTLLQYLEKSIGRKQSDKLSSRKISIDPGYRKEFWHKNCLAIGLSAGFVEPLEASALVLVELSANMLAEQFPANRETMDIIAKRFNEKFTYRWEQIIDFLKLHYVLTQRRDSDYWQDNRRSDSVPDSLKESLLLWKTQAPWHNDTPHIDEMFPWASFQYVLYGMGFTTEPDRLISRHDEQLNAQAGALLRENQQQVKKLLSILPQNRDLLNKIKEFGFQRI